MVYTLKKAWLSVDSLIRVSEWVLFLQYMEYIWNCADWIMTYYIITRSRDRTWMSCDYSHAVWSTLRLSPDNRHISPELYWNPYYIIMTSLLWHHHHYWNHQCGCGLRLVEGLYLEKVSKDNLPFSSESQRNDETLRIHLIVVTLVREEDEVFFPTYLSSIFIPQSHWSYNLRIYNIFLKKTFLEFTHEVRGANL